jgi:hypothetical protein
MVQFGTNPSARRGGCPAGTWSCVGRSVSLAAAVADQTFLEHRDRVVDG